MSFMQFHAQNGCRNFDGNRNRSTKKTSALGFKGHTALKRDIYGKYWREVAEIMKTSGNLNKFSIIFNV